MKRELTNEINDKLTAAFALIAMIVLVVAYLGLRGTASLTSGIIDVGAVCMPSLAHLTTIDRAYNTIESSASLPVVPESGLTVRGPSTDRQCRWRVRDKGWLRQEDARGDDGSRISCSCGAV